MHSDDQKKNNKTHKTPHNSKQLVWLEIKDS